MRDLENTTTDQDDLAKLEPLRVAACTCRRGFERSRVACETCQRFDRALRRLCGEGGGHAQD